MAPSLREAKALTLQSKQRRQSSAESGDSLLVVRAAAVDAYLSPVETVSVQAVSPLRLVIVTAFVGISVAYHPGSDRRKDQQQAQPERGIEQHTEHGELDDPEHRRRRARGYPARHQ